MTLALLLGACALTCWPAPPRVAAARRPTPRSPSARSRLDGLTPLLLATAVLLLTVGWRPTWAGAGAGVAAAAATYAGLRRFRSRPATTAIDPRMPLTLTVAGLLLRAGAPPADALAAAARGCRSSSRTACDQVQRRLAMGEPAWRAWSGLDSVPELAPVGRAAVRATDSGAALAAAWEAVGTRLRAERRLAAEVRARKVGVRVLAPLGLCFLPSFICLGVVPMVIGLAGDIL